MLANSNLSEVAATYLYMMPHFTTSYRFAQFAYTVSHRKHYADIVKVLDLSNLGKEEEELRPQAGWREFKYRDSHLHKVNRDRHVTSIDPCMDKSVDKGIQSLKRPLPSLDSRRGAWLERSLGKTAILPPTSHPPPSPFLSRFHYCRDVPAGAVCHALAACQNIR
jgi:hypothetical protein